MSQSKQLYFGREHVSKLKARYLFLNGYIITFANVKRAASGFITRRDHERKLGCIGASLPSTSGERDRSFLLAASFRAVEKDTTSAQYPQESSFFFRHFPSSYENKSKSLNPPISHLLLRSSTCLLIKKRKQGNSSKCKPNARGN